MTQNIITHYIITSVDLICYNLARTSRKKRDYSERIIITYNTILLFITKELSHNYSLLRKCLQYHLLVYSFINSIIHSY